MVAFAKVLRTKRPAIHRPTKSDVASEPGQDSRTIDQCEPQRRQNMRAGVGTWASPELLFRLDVQATHQSHRSPSGNRVVAYPPLSAGKSGTNVPYEPHQWKWSGQRGHVKSRPRTTREHLANATCRMSPERLQHRVSRKVDVASRVWIPIALHPTTNYQAIGPRSNESKEETSRFSMSVSMQPAVK